MAKPGQNDVTESHVDTVGLFLFDADCGFCSRSVHVLKSRVNALARYLPFQEADVSQFGLTAQDCRQKAWFVVGDDVYGGAAAFCALCRHSRQPVRTVGLFLGLPGVRGAAEIAYRWVARHRYQLPGGSSSCRL